MSDDDLTLVRRAADGDEGSFELLVRRHTESIWRLAYGMLRDRGAAEDVTQEVFVKAYRSLGSFRGDAAVRTWLLAIANRACIDQLRRRREAVVSLDAAREERARERDHALRIALEEAIAELPEDERQAFMLVDVMGLTREEAASVSEIPASTLKSRLARAHGRLVEAVAEDERPRRAKRSR